MTTTRPNDGGTGRAALQWLRLRSDRAAEATLLSIAAAVLILTYRAVSRTPFVADQLSYLASGGVAGLFLLAVGLRLRITGDLRDEWHKLDRIEAALHEAALADTDEPLVNLSDRDRSSAEPTSGRRRREPVASQRGTLAVSAAVAVSLALFVDGWWRAAHAATVSTAFRGFGLAAAAGVLLTVEVCVPALSIRRRLGQRKARLLGPFLVGAPQAVLSSAAGSPDVVVVAPGLTRFHRHGCPATAGLAVELIDRGRAAATLGPCEICAGR
jgi:hypothetical protein